jgi:hypothetical protein
MTAPWKLSPFVLKNHPWADPDPDDGVMPGAAEGQWIEPLGAAVLYHTTSTGNAAQILKHGFIPSPTREVGGFPALGIPGRQAPGGIWASIRPTVPGDSDAYWRDLGESWEVLQLLVPIAVLLDRCHFDTTWPVAQFALEPADVMCVFQLAPSAMPGRMHPETVRKIASYRHDYHGANPYLDALDAAAAAQALQEEHMRGIGKQLERLEAGATP